MARYASSDWHGQMELAKQVMDFLQPNDELYFLGDAIDRGSAGYEIMKRLLTDKRVTYLKGNHEDMLTKCVPEFLEGHMYNQSWWCWQNGGQDTWDAIEKLPEDVAISLVHMLNQLPERVDLVNAKGQNLILTHAGTDPDKDKRYWEMMGVHDPYIWNRKHIHHQWTGDDNTFVIHGHTPVEYILDVEKWANDEAEEDETFIPTVRFYCQGHKIDMDMGSFYTGRTAIMNLDTFEVTYFEARPEGKWAD
jgi:serine/threonine protein phosphatase 1